MATEAKEKMEKGGLLGSARPGFAAPRSSAGPDKAGGSLEGQGGSATSGGGRAKFGSASVPPSVACEHSC